MENSNKLIGLKQHSRESNDLTRESLKTALVALAREKDYKSLTVTEVCRRAGVSRMAFYRNYSVIGDIFHELTLDMNNLITEAIGSPFRKRTSEEWYTNVFNIIAQNKDAMALMFTEEFQFEWMKTVNGIIVYDDDFPNEKKYQRLMWCGGFENAVSYWLSNGLKESPEEMAVYCLNYLPHLLNNEN